MKVLIVGNKGQLGWALENQAAINGVSTEGADLPELDLTSREDVKRLVSRDRFSVVVNAAAYTAVDKAESDVDTAFAVNRDGVAYLTEACRENKIPLIHISTDYVFNGTSTVPYKAEDPVDPLGVYGRSKAEGETAIREILPQHVIIRTSWLYGIHGQNFVKTMIRLAKERTELRVVNDQRGCPTFAGDLAAAIMDIISSFGNEDELRWGTYHYCNSGETSWYYFAEKAIALASEFEKMAIERIEPIMTVEYPTPAPRPAYSVLDCGSFVLTFGIKVNKWEESLAKMIEALYVGNNEK